MGLPVTGQWAAQNANAADYSGALKWGTGVSPIYGEHGIGPPLSVTGRNPDDIPYGEVPVELWASGPEYGYTMEDLPPGTDDDFMQLVPSWPERPETTRGDSGRYPPPSWLPRPNGPSGNWLRTIHQVGMLKAAHDPTAFPTETVTEGWDNKLSGEILTAETSDQSQYERQTSMQQVDPPAGRNNDLAVARGTDDPRYNIRTRLTGMKIKPWSEGERLQDMFPFQQDLMLRPWRYRTAGTGIPQWMVANEFQSTEPIQRNVPSEPYYGPDESAGSDVPDYGYTSEDVTTYG